MSWLAGKLHGLNVDGCKIVFSWPGRGEDTLVELENLFQYPEVIYQGRKDGPKSITIISGYRNVRRFKSPKQFIEDLEKTAIKLVHNASLHGLLDR